MTDLAEFLEQFVSVQGGDCERSPEQLTVLPPPLFPIQDVQTFWMAPQEPREDQPSRLFPGHPFLEAVLETARRDSRVLVQHATQSPSRRADLASAAARHFAVRNCSLSCANPTRVVSAWVTFTYAVTYVWDDKRQEVRSLTLDSLHGYVVDPIGLTRSWLEPGPLDSVTETDHAWLHGRAQSLLERAMSERTKRFQAESDRQLAVELARTERYYGELIRDQSRRQSAEAKVARTQAELESRRRDLRDKFRLRVQARLVAVRVVDLARTQLEARLTRKGLTRHFRITHNPLTQEFDPVCCDHCQTGTQALFLCDEKHILCDGCRGECSMCRQPLCPICLGLQLLPKCCAACVERTQREATPPARPVPDLLPRPNAPVSPAAPSRPTLSTFFREFRYIDLQPEIEALDSLLASGKMQAVKARLGELCGCIDPELELLSKRAMQVLRCFRDPSPDRVFDGLVKLQQKLAHSELASSAAKAPNAKAHPQPSENSHRLLLKQIESCIPPQCEHRTRELLVQDCQRIVSHLGEMPLEPRLLLACLIYIRTNLRQKDAAELCGVSVAKVSLNYHRVVGWMNEARREPG